MKTKTEIKPSKLSMPTEALKMVNAKYRITLNDMDFADVCAIATALQNLSDFYLQVAGTNNIDATVAESLLAAANSITTYANAFNVQPLIENGRLKRGLSFIQD
jgi:hypothetical protein